MLVSLFITLRETLEASLVVGIILAFLERTQSLRYKGAVWSGVGAGIGGSILLAALFQSYLGGLSGHAEQLYEGVMMLAAAGLITWMILWMLRQGAVMRHEIEERVGGYIDSSYPLGIFFLTFISVLREGVETAIFLQAAFLQSQDAYHHLGAVLGIVIAISASWLLFKGIRFFSLRHFFTATGILLILFAAGLTAHGVHELEEAGVLPVTIEHVWDINPVVMEEGAFPAFHENGAVGSLFKGLFGYNGDPSLLEVMSYTLYLIVIAVAWRWRTRKPGVAR